MTSSEQTDRRSLMKEALLEIDRLQAELDANRQSQHAPIAIIGLGCRFPGAENPTAFWRLLADGVDAIREVPADRWDIAAYYDPDPDAPGKMSTRFGGFIEDVDRFDANFFNIAPCEAECMDPQQRLLLEVSWEALEHAGVSPHELLGSETGVFLGICHSDYVKLLSTTEPGTLDDEYRGMGNALSVAAGRLSYFLGLRGPSLAVDTACSSSLVATHLAVSSLRKGECRLALVGGVNLMLTPDQTICFSNAHMLAPDGRCKTFDAAADGYVRGEGCGVVVIKRLADALADGDNVLAVIRGSAINQDGRSAGLTAPNGPAQEAVIRAALADASIQPQQVDYIEAHGTGTSLGDPIEVHALARTIARHRSADAPLSLGSVKTNLGHLEAAAGIAGLIKLVLALQHDEVPPHLHFNQLNPHISVNGAPIRISSQRTPWPPGEHRLRTGGVSSFGFGGTNAHLIVSEAPPPENGTTRQTRPLQLLVLSAKNEQALRDLAAGYRRLLASAATPSLQDVCYTAAIGRAHHDHRLAVIAADRQEAADKLRAYVQGQHLPGLMSQRSEPNQIIERVVFASAAANTVETQRQSNRVLQAVTHGAPAQVWQQHLDETATLYVQGANVDWRGFYNHEKRPRALLPTYPFQRERYWVEDAETFRPTGTRQIDRPRGTPSAAATKPTLLGYRLDSPLPIFELVLNKQAIPALKEHLILQLPVVPASVYVHLALVALRELFGRHEVSLVDVDFRQMLVLDDRLCTLQLILQTDDGEPTGFQLYSARESEPDTSNWTLHASGKVASGATGSKGGVPLSDLRFRLRDKVDTAGFYEQLRGRGVEYGPAFQCLDQVSRRDGEALGRLQLSQAVQREAVDCPLHPVLLAAALPLVAVSLPRETRDADDQRPLVPTRLASLYAHRDLVDDCWVHVRTRQIDAGTIEADLRMLDDSGKPVVQIAGLRLERLGELAAAAAQQDAGLDNVQTPSALANARRTKAAIRGEDLLNVVAAGQRELMEAYLQKLFAEALRMDESQLAVDEPLHRFGLDSLMIAKLATRLQRELNVHLELGELMERPSVSQLATLVIDRLTQPQAGEVSSTR